MEIPIEIVKECKERFGDEAYFRFIPHLGKIVCTVKDQEDPFQTYTLFTVEDENRDARNVTMEDIYRVERAKTFDSPAKKQAKQELTHKMAKERREAITRKPSKKKEIITAMGTEMEKNPILARAFVADAKRKYSGTRARSIGNKTIITPGK